MEKSGGNNTTFGFNEKFDLKHVVDWVEDRQGTDLIIGTHGESLGAATCLQHVAMDDRIEFVVEDCGYAHLMDLFHFRMRADYKLPGLIFLPLGSVFIRLLAGFWPQAIKPEEMISTVETPIFFIHGADDSYIPPEHAKRLYAAKKNGFRKLWLAPNAEHALSQPENPREYDQKIGEFLEETHIIT